MATRGVAARKLCLDEPPDFGLADQEKPKVYPLILHPVTCDGMLSLVKYRRETTGRRGGFACIFQA